MAAAALVIAAAAPVTVDALQASSSAPGAQQGCRVLEQAPFERVGARGTRIRNLCVGAAAAEQARLLPKAALYRLSPEGAVVPGRRSIRLDGHEAAIDAATLIALDRRVSYRITYWYEIGGVATGSKIGLKWRAALQLLEGRGTDVAVVTEIEAQDAAR